MPIIIDPRPRGAATAVLTIALLAGLVAAPPVRGQAACPRIMEQDSTLNHLVDPPGYRTAAPGTLGRVTRSGAGRRAMILIPGFGFGGDVLADFGARFADRYRIYSVTLPGFGGTPAPPSPGAGVSFGEQTWTLGAVGAIERLIADEGLTDPIVVGHWIGGTQIALRLAMHNPDRVRAVVLLAGAARMVVADTAFARHYGTPARRVASVDRFLAPRWFRTVTRETWDDNNFMPADYAVHPVRGLRLWRAAATPDLHVWVRYLCEFNAQDVTAELDRVTVPALLLRPGLEGLWHEPGRDYLRGYVHEGWGPEVERLARFTVRTIPDSRVCLWFDQPGLVHEAVAEFLKSVE